WWEEALAQQLEARVGGAQPELSTKHLAESGRIPGLFDLSRPIRGHESYALTYLFAKYIRQEFGGWETLRPMAFPKDDGNRCVHDFEDSASEKFFSGLICQARTERQGALAAPAMEKLTPAGVLRYFYTALSMNNPNHSAYWIAGWQGLRKLPR